VSAPADGFARDAMSDDGGGLPHRRHLPVVQTQVPAAKVAAPKPAKRREWTSEDRAFLAKHLRRKGTAWVAAKLGRGVRSIQCAALRYGISRHWTEREVAILRAEWGELSERGLRQKLAGRAWGGIVFKAHSMGLGDPNQGLIYFKEAIRQTGVDRKRLLMILDDAGVKRVRRVRLKSEVGGYRQWMVDGDRACAAVVAWLSAQARRLNRAEIIARTGLSAHHVRRALLTLAAVRPVEGFRNAPGQAWLVSPEDADAAAAMYRAARGER